MSHTAIVVNTAVAIIAVVVMIVRFKFNPVVSLVVGSAYLGLAAGLGVEKTIDAIMNGIRRHHGRGRPADRVRRVDGRNTAADRRHSAAGANAAEAVRTKAHALCHVADDRDAASVDLSRCAACHLGTAGPQPGQEDRQERNRADGDGHGHRPRMRNRSDRSRCGRACAGRPARRAARQDAAVRCAACDSHRGDLRGDHVVPVQSRLVEPGARRAGVPRRGSRTPR